MTASWDLMNLVDNLLIQDGHSTVGPYKQSGIDSPRLTVQYQDEALELSVRVIGKL